MSIRYLIEDESGRAVAPGEITCAPAYSGQQIVLLNYPRVERYLVARLRPRQDWMGDHDHFDRYALVLTADPTENSGPDLRNVAIFMPACPIVQRLRRAWKIAQEEIEERLSLSISRKDFEALCLSIGLFDAERGTLAGLAYMGAPMRRAEDQDASTSFDGFKGDLAIVRVTRRDGTPFEIDPFFTSAIVALLADPTSDNANRIRNDILGHLGAGGDVAGDVPRHVRDMLQLVYEGEMTVFLAAQELTELGYRLRTRAQHNRVA
ncbi:hypothetical protein [Asticcacaulis sp. YBE204]|uniref:hypothetical protein n=1 Tax=Asticcacaulis sp. YBE204 TaxID=1282363 RepID=UPI0003C3C979|nr:hypothetical protein [Asticcacaulis sp. YBE204]ESQ79312.1 hypothetical protein AEYBE204_09900 [Asticcacaulis sp. YBE204]